MSQDKLKPSDLHQTRVFLDGRDSSLKAKIANIAQPSSSLVFRQPDFGRLYFGIGLLILSLFILVVFLCLPIDENRWIIYGFGWVTLFAGAWQADLARR